jgi:hypothetical protein
MRAAEHAETAYLDRLGVRELRTLRPAPTHPAALLSRRAALLT